MTLTPLVHSGDELRRMNGLGAVVATFGSIRQIPASEPFFNPGFDVGTGIITERGVCKASREGLAGLYPEFAA